VRPTASRRQKSIGPKLILDARPRRDVGLEPRTESVFRKAVAYEMLQARESARDRTFDPTDARWRLATETQQALQGAVLAFEDRRELLALANRLGIRSFDANLIVALVQDRARRGEPLQSAAATIAMLPNPQGKWPKDTVHAQGERGLAWIWIAAMVTAVAVDALLVGWLMFS
jgi:hypothetical protein